MPPFRDHLASSSERTGKEYRELHDWLDNHPDRQIKEDRHSLDNLTRNIEYVGAAWGEEAVKEFLRHVVEDLAAKDIEILRKAGCPEEAIVHSVEVARKALEISSRAAVNADRRLVVRGAIYHDLGKAKTLGIRHGEIGAEMAWELKLGDSIINIILKHIRGGLTGQEALELGLPVRDYTLRTPEEKMVICADRMVDIYTDGIVPGIDEKKSESLFEEILGKYEKYGKNHATAERYINLHREIREWMSGQNSN